MKRITITIEIDIDENSTMPKWYEGKSNNEIEDYLDDQTFDFVDKLEIDIGLGRENLNYSQVEEWES
jgi:hypothetical protein